MQDAASGQKQALGKGLQGLSKKALARVVCRQLQRGKTRLRLQFPKQGSWPANAQTSLPYAWESIDDIP